MNIAINGFGRIGRATLKSFLSKKSKNKLVAINDLTDINTLVHLLKNDSCYGQYDKKIKAGKDFIVIGNQKIKVLAEKNPLDLPWKKMKVDIVIECTGRFRTKKDASLHIKAGAKKVILSAPAKKEIDSKDGKVKTVVMGINEKSIKKTDQIISNASCTTNCYAPITKILHDNFFIERSFMVTVHAVTNDQRVLDLPHKDLRRSRSILDNIIPTTSGSDKATVAVIPSLEGKLHTMAMRVPVKVGSVIYATYDLKKKPKIGEINKIIKKASEKEFKNIIKYETEPIVSTDIVGSPYSAIFDSLLTEGDNDLVKIVVWYDNEWGYSSRLVDLIEYISKNKLV